MIFQQIKIFYYRNLSNRLINNRKFIKFIQSTYYYQQKDLQVFVSQFAPTITCQIQFLQNKMMSTIHRPNLEQNLFNSLTNSSSANGLKPDLKLISNKKILNSCSKPKIATSLIKRNIFTQQKQNFSEYSASKINIKDLLPKLLSLQKCQNNADDQRILKPIFHHKENKENLQMTSFKANLQKKQTQKASIHQFTQELQTLKEIHKQEQQTWGKQRYSWNQQKQSWARQKQIWDRQRQSFLNELNHLKILNTTLNCKVQEISAERANFGKENAGMAKDNSKNLLKPSSIQQDNQNSNLDASQELADILCRKVQRATQELQFFIKLSINYKSQIQALKITQRQNSTCFQNITHQIHDLKQVMIEKDEQISQNKQKIRQISKRQELATLQLNKYKEQYESLKKRHLIMQGEWRKNQTQRQMEEQFQQLKQKNHLLLLRYSNLYESYRSLYQEYINESQETDFIRELDESAKNEKNALFQTHNDALHLSSSRSRLFRQPSIHINNMAHLYSTCENPVKLRSKLQSIQSTQATTRIQKKPKIILMQLIKESLQENV